MRKWLMTSTAVAWALFAGGPVSAEPVTIAALMSQGVGFFSAVAATSGAFAASVLQIGASALLTAGINAIFAKTPSTPELKREFPARTSLPGKRYVYGRTRMTGTPVPWRVQGGVLVGCILFNSRPSAGGNVRITIDGRRCEFVNRGDATPLTDPADWNELYDFTSQGQLVRIMEKFPDWDEDEEQFFCWLGLGDQTAPPDRVLSSLSDDFEATDGWQGQTVLWVWMSAGGSEEKRPKRWPNPEPQVEVEMDWSKVWDSTDPAQDADDPDTWTYSDNQGRCLLDAVRQNPVRAYDTDQLLLETFTDGVTLADEQVLRYHDTQTAGSNVYEPRYRVAGVIDWSKGELLDLIQPLANAGAGRLAVVGGRLSYVPGAYQAPVYEMTDILEEDGIEFQRLGSRRDVPHALKGTWTSEEQEYETAELAPWLVPGGSARIDDVEDLPLPMIPSGTQCQRVTSIEAQRRAAQKELKCTLPPSAAKLIPGSTLVGNLPAPFTRLNGGWQVQEANPGVWLADGEDGQLAFRVPVSLRQESASIYAWTPSTDERQLITEDLTEETVFTGTVSGLVAQTVEVNTGGAVVLMIEFEFDPVSGYVIDEYEVSWREAGTTKFIPLPDIPSNAIDDDGNVSGRFGPVAFDQVYDLGVRAIGPTSDGAWSYVTGIVAGIAFSSVSAVLGASTGELDVTATAPDSGYFWGIRLYRADVGDSFNEAVRVDGSTAPSPGETFTLTFDGIPLGAGDFWITPYTTTNSNGTPTYLGTFTII